MTIVKISQTMLVNLDNVQGVSLADHKLHFVTSATKDVAFTKFCDTAIIAYEAFEFLNERLKAGDTFIDIAD